MSIWEFPGMFESTNLGRDSLSRKIGHNILPVYGFGSIRILLLRGEIFQLGNSPRMV